MRFFQLDARLFTAAKLARRVVDQRLGRARPLFATFFVTRRCNVRCTGCWYYDVLDPALRASEPDTATAVAILRRLGEGGVPVVQIAGGEPFLRRDLATLLRAGRDAGLSLAIITNGMLVSASALGAVDEACEWALYSPHVPEELSPESGRRQYEQGWEGFRRMRRALSRPHLACAVTVSRLTVPRLGEILGRALAAGADSVKFQPVFTPAMFPSPAEARHAVEVIGSFQARYPDRIAVSAAFLSRFAAFFGPAPTVACTVRRFFHIGVHVDGTVCACCPMDQPLGSLLEAPLEALLAREVAEQHDCYGCQRLDIVQALRLCGAGAPATVAGSVARRRPARSLSVVGQVRE